MDTKTCSKCGDEKSLDCFAKDKRSKDGHCGRCKLCQKAYREANKAEISEYNKVCYQANRERRLEYQKAYVAANKHKIDAYQKAYRKVHYQENKEMCAEKGKIYRKSERGKALRKAAKAKRRATKLDQTPPDADLDLIKQIFDRCPEGYHVDHVVPLALGGLHHQGNLCYLPASENCAKGDKTLEEYGYERFYTHAIWPKLSKQN